MRRLLSILVPTLLFSVLTHASTLTNTEEVLQQSCIRYQFGAMGKDIPFAFEATGLSGVEPTHRWTEGEERTVSFKIPTVLGQNRVRQVVFENVWVHVPQRVSVMLNDVEMQQLDFTPQARQSITVLIPPHLADFSVIKFLTPGACPPACNPNDLRILGMSLITMALHMGHNAPHANSDLEEAVSKVRDFSAFYLEVLKTQKRLASQPEPQEHLDRFISSLVFLTGSVDRVIKRAHRVEAERRANTPDEGYQYALDLNLLEQYKHILQINLEKAKENMMDEGEVNWFFMQHFSAWGNRPTELIDRFKRLHGRAIYAIYQAPEFQCSGVPICLDHYVSQFSAFKQPCGTWISIDRAGGQLDQGWKLHVSAKSATALKILQIVQPILERRGVSYKYAGSMAYLDWLNEMINQRGKFMTIYPRSDNEAADIAREIDLALQGCSKNDFVTTPYDAPLGNTGGLFARYGGFTTDTLIERDPVTLIEIGRHADRRIGPYRPSWVNSQPFAELLQEPEKPHARYQPAP